MSNDGVLLVNRIEKRFGIGLSDEQVEKISTIGQLCEYLTAQARILHQRPCASAWMFYRLRRVLVDHVPVSKRLVHPRVPLARLIPFRHRKRVWQELQYEFGNTLPKLQWGNALRYGLLIFCTLSAVTMLAGTIASGAWEYLFVLPFVWALVCWVAMMIATPFARHIPAQVATPAAVVQYLMPFEGLPFNEPASAIEPWIFENICQVTAETLEVNAHELTRSTHFMEDLGLR